MITIYDLFNFPRISVSVAYLNSYQRGLGSTPMCAKYLYDTMKINGAHALRLTS